MAEEELKYSETEATLAPIAISKIEYKDERTQSRVCMSEAHVNKLVKAIKRGADIEPVILFFDGEKYWVADGFHRIHAHFALGLGEVQAWVYRGSFNDALLAACRANVEHSQVLTRSRADKRKAVALVLTNPYWQNWSTHYISRMCQVSRKVVTDVRKKLAAEGKIEFPTTRRTTVKNGKIVHFKLNPPPVNRPTYDRPGGKRHTTSRAIAEDLKIVTQTQREDLAAALAKEDIILARNLVRHFFYAIYKVDPELARATLKEITKYRDRAAALRDRALSRPNDASSDD